MNTRLYGPLAMAICAALVLSPSPATTRALAQAADPVHVLHVPQDFATIQAAVDSALAGDIIQIAGGVYYENVVVQTSGLRLHAQSGVVLDGSLTTGAATGLSKDIGISVKGASAVEPVTDVEISGFEVRNFERGIIVQFGSHTRVHDNDVHDNDQRAPGLVVLGNAAGIELVTTTLSEVTQNFAHHNGNGGIQLRVGSTRNTISGNAANENGFQNPDPTDGGLQGLGILVTGAGTNDNQIEENEVIGNSGRGIMISRPSGTAPVTGTLVRNNRLHENQRSGIAIMNAAKENVVTGNDARGNNLSGLPPCHHCNLFDLSDTIAGFGDNLWARNIGTFNLTDGGACLIR